MRTTSNILAMYLIVLVEKIASSIDIVDSVVIFFKDVTDFPVKNR